MRKFPELNNVRRLKQELQAQLESFGIRCWVILHRKEGVLGLAVCLSEGAEVSPSIPQMFHEVPVRVVRGSEDESDAAKQPV